MNIQEAKNSPWLLTESAYEIYRQCMYRATFSDYAAEIKSISENPDCRIFVCGESGKNRGIIILESAAAETAEIVGIAVEKTLQKNGIGKYMVFSAARGMNVKTLFAETDDGAVEFYKHIGFIVKPFVRHFDDGDVVRYKCNISI